MADEVGTYSIKELTGPGRVLVLSQRALPYRPYTVSGSQRAKVQYYPGSPVATLQFLGASEDEATINGMWKDKYIADGLTGVGGFVNSLSSFVGAGPGPMAVLNGSPVGTVHDLVKAVDDIRRAGQLLEVAWLSVQRRGYMKKFTQKWHNLHDCEWEIEFEWVAQNEEQDSQLAISSQKTDLPSISDLMGKLSAAMQDAAVPTVTRLFSITKSIADINEQVQGYADNISDAINSYVDGINAPADAVRSAMSSLQATIDSADNLNELVRDRVDSSILIGADTLDGIAAVTEGFSIGASFSQRQLLAASNNTRRQAVRGSLALLASINPDLVFAYYARTDQDLRDVSIKYYGDPDGWRYLMQYNAMSTSRIPSGQVVLVPKTREGSA